MIELFPIERAAIEAIAAEYPEFAAAINEQLHALRVEGRTNTGAGFYTDFEFNAEVPSIPVQSPIGEPFAEVEGLERGMGFLLAIKGGKMAYLEGYSFDDSPKPLDFENVRFKMRPHPIQ